MKQNYGYISKETTNRDLLIIMKGTNIKNTRYLPVIDNLQDKKLLGVIETKYISQYLEYEVNSEAGQLDFASKKLFVDFYKKLLIFKNKTEELSCYRGSMMENNDRESQMDEDIDSKLSIDLHMKRLIGKFWYSKINISSQYLKLDNSPFVILTTASVSKVHFVFAMLNLKYAMIIDDGKLMGTLSKSYFVKKMKE